MRLIYSEYGLDINLSEGNVSVLCVEKQNIFTLLVSEIWNQYDSNVGGWVLLDCDTEINISKKLLCVLNPIELDLNDKKLLKILYQDIALDVHDNRLDEFGDVNSRLMLFVDELVSHQPYSIEFNDSIDVIDLLKLYNVGFTNDSDCILEKIVECIKLWHRVAGIKVFVFVHLMAYLQKAEMEKLYTEIKYEQVCVLLIESCFSVKIADECVKIIDKDLCIIDC